MGGANLPSIIALLSERQKERDALVAEMASGRMLNQLHVDRDAIEAKVQKRGAEWRGLVGRSVASGRQVLWEVLAAPLSFGRDGKTTGSARR